MSEIIPAAHRRTAYRISAVIALALGCTQVGYAAADAGQPSWLTVALAVYTFAAGGLGVLAAVNTPTNGRQVRGGGLTP